MAMPTDDATLPNRRGDGVPTDAGGDVPTEIAPVDPRLGGLPATSRMTGGARPFAPEGPAHNFQHDGGRDIGNAPGGKASGAARNQPAGSPRQYPTGGVGSFMNLRPNFTRSLPLEFLGGNVCAPKFLGLA